MKNDIIEKYINEPVINVDPDLELKEELVSIHAINPFVSHNSSPRSYMLSSHLSQIVTIINGEEKIIQTGIEYQLAQNTFSKKADADFRLIKIINRYNMMGANTVNKINYKLLIVENLETGEIDYIEVPYYFSLHQTFGFKYVWNKDILNNILPKDIIRKDTILADSPTVKENNGYAFGVNANIALTTIPEVSEDGVVISTEFAKKLSYNIFETRVIEYGSESFPLNLYGDEHTYKPFPEIGEYINQDSVVMALRKYSDDFAHSLMSANDLRDFNPVFDEAVYVRGPGEKTTNGDVVSDSGKVVDIKVYHSPKYKKEVYTGTSDVAHKYVNALNSYYENLIETVEALQKDHYNKYKNNDMRISEKLHRLLIDAYAITNKGENKIRFNHRNEQLDIFRIEMVIQYTVVPTIGSKITDLSGSKGVVIEVRPPELMPVDEYGNVADIIMDPSSIPSRMNVGRLYEQYFNAMSRHTKKLVIEIMENKSAYELSEPTVIKAFDTVLGLLELIGTEQYTSYLNTSYEQKLEILEEIRLRELYILYKISSKKKAYQIVLKTQQTMYAPPLGRIRHRNVKDGVTKRKIFIAPLYIILLARTADNFLSTASPKVNHFGLPIGVSNKSKNLWPFRNSPVKIISETESRLYAAYSRSVIGPAELKDRANSIPTHEHIYRNILSADVPTNIHRVVDREVVPYGQDSSLDIINNIFNAAGMSIEYIHDSTEIHPKI